MVTLRKPDDWNPNADKVVDLYIGKVIAHIADWGCNFLVMSWPLLFAGWMLVITCDDNDNVNDNMWTYVYK